MAFEASLDYQLPVAKEEKTSLPCADETRETKTPALF
jgi:hypothetical protein